MPQDCFRYRPVPVPLESVVIRGVEAVLADVHPFADFQLHLLEQQPADDLRAGDVELPADDGDGFIFRRLHLRLNPIIELGEVLHVNEDAVQFSVGKVADNLHLDVLEQPEKFLLLKTRLQLFEVNPPRPVGVALRVVLERGFVENVPLPFSLGSLVERPHLHAELALDLLLESVFVKVTAKP